MSILAKEVVTQFRTKGMNIERVVEGKILSSLEMHGFSLTVLTLDDPDDIVHIDYPTDCRHFKATPIEESISIPNEFEVSLPKNVITLDQTGNKFKSVIFQLFSELQGKEEYYNKLDALSGDGDMGIGVKKSADSVLLVLDCLDFSESLVDSMTQLGQIVAKAFGGTSGPLYGSFLISAAGCLNNRLSENDLSNWQNAFTTGVEMIQRLGRAQVGDRTMVDVLHHAAE